MAKRCAGINVPVFSLRSKQSLGCGELLDLIPLIDWASDTGFKIIQILPINDTSTTETDQDRYPYSILSGFALHPIYLNLQALAPALEHEIFRPFLKELNLPEFDYGRTYFAKKELLKMLYIMRGEKDLESEAFLKFYDKNRDHLRPYAAFCALRDRHKTSDFSKWGRAKIYSELLVEEVCEKMDVSFYYFIQFHLDKQMKQVVSYAKKRGVLIKGDFPMGIHPHSVEAWRFHEYFRWDQSMGAPPDFYNDQGQNWDFPSYDWDEIREEMFFWLTSRLRWMESYFNIVRLDHVLGYFRLWEIPVTEKSGLMGSFFPSIGYSDAEFDACGLKQKPKKELFFFRHNSYHPRVDMKKLRAFSSLSSEQQKIALQLFYFYFFERQEELWKLKGLEKLSVMKNATKMELCAEDIGVIPNCVAEVLTELRMLNLHVQRMPKSFEIEFENPKDFPESCVCTPSNHDTATLRQWWEEDPDATRRYYHTILKKDGDPPKQLTGELAEEIIRAHLASNARYAIFLLQDLLAINEDIRLPNPLLERINDPAYIEGQWNYRMHLYVEELLLYRSFSQRIKNMLEETNR